MRRYVIAGNGIAAAGCIEGIRSMDPDGEITVVSGEDRPAYYRPLISYYLEGKADPARMAFGGADFYERNRVRVLSGRRAVRLVPERREAVLDDGTVLPYTALCVAAGSSPFVPPFEGLENVREKFSFMTLGDAEALKAAVRPDSRVLIVGAGLIGLKCAEGLADLAGSITVCDLAGRVLSSILDDECAAVMQRHLEERGITFFLSDSASRFGEHTAFMKSGAEIPFDVLVLAVGVRANTALVKDAGGDTNRGILVDGKMRTSLPDVYAAGDCAEGYDLSAGQKRVLAILPNAYLGGHAAGVNMAGGSASFENAIPMNSIGFFGLHAMTAGAYEGDLYEEKTETSVKRLYTKDGLLRGFILIGGSERAGIYTSMIRERTPLDSVDFGLMKKAASTAAFSPEVRRQKFGSVV